MERIANKTIKSLDMLTGTLSGLAKPLILSFSSLKLHRVLLLLVASCICPFASADAPLAAPKKYTECSSSKKICATSDPKKNITHIFAIDSKKILFSIPGWHRWLIVADDGKSVVVGFDGLNLVPADVTLQEPVLFIYNQGKLVRSVNLGDLYQSKSQLIRSSSHLYWVRTIVFNQSNQLVVSLANMKEIVFDSKSGKILN